MADTTNTLFQGLKPKIKAKILVESKRLHIRGEDLVSRVFESFGVKSGVLTKISEKTDTSVIIEVYVKIWMTTFHF